MFVESEIAPLAFVVGGFVFQTALAERQLKFRWTGMGL